MSDKMSEAGAQPAGKLPEFAENALKEWEASGHQAKINGRGIAGYNSGKPFTPREFDNMLAEQREGMEAFGFLVTPELAEHMLGKNIPNRRIKRPRLLRLIHDMEVGHFQLTHQGIAFNTAGQLIDGQHRLAAIMTSGVPTILIVWFGVPRGTLATIDTGAPRSALDIFATNQRPISSDTLSAIKDIMAIDDAEAGKKLRRSGANASETDDIEFFDENRALIDATREWVQKLTGKPSSKVRAGVFTALFRIRRKLGDNTLEFEDFATKLTTGLGIKDASDPVYKVRQRIGEDNGMTLAAEITKAWNAIRAGKPLKHLSWRKDEDFPKVAA